MNEAEIAAGLAQTPSYRYAERVGRQLFVAGQVPRDSKGDLVGLGDASRQVEQCLRNLELLVRHHGFSAGDIRKLVLYVAGNRDEMNAAWSSVVNWFGESVPPATLLGVAMLGYVGQLVEVDATVVAASDKANSVGSAGG